MGRGPNNLSRQQVHESHIQQAQDRLADKNRRLAAAEEGQVGGQEQRVERRPRPEVLQVPGKAPPVGQPVGRRQILSLVADHAQAR